MGMKLKEREKLFLQMVSQGHTYKDAYIAILKSRKGNKQINDSSAEVSGSRMAKRLRKDIEGIKVLKEIKEKKVEIEQRLDYVNKLETVERKEKVIALRKKKARTVKEQTEIMELLKYDVSNAENLVRMRGFLLEKGIEEFEMTSSTDNAPYKASIFKSCIDILKMDIPEKIPTNIDLSKAPKEILQGIIKTKGLDKEVIKLLMQHVDSVNQKTEMEELEQLLKQTQQQIEE